MWVCGSICSRPRVRSDSPGLAARRPGPGLPLMSSSKLLQIALVTGIAGGLAGRVWAAAPLLDNWEHASQSTSLLVNGRPVFDPPSVARQGSYTNRRILLDYSRQKVGAFSISPAKELSARANGFAFRLPSLSAGRGRTVEVSGWIATPPAGNGQVSITSADGHAWAEGTATLEQADAAGWCRFTAKLETLSETGPSGALLQIRWASPGISGTGIDGVQLQIADSSHGITDRPLETWIQEAKHTRADRVRAAIEHGAESDFSGRDRQIIDQLWLGRNVSSNNAELREHYRRTLQEHSTWSLTTKMRLIQAYYELGSRSRFQPGRLEPETEALLLEVLWKFTRVTNDIATTRQSTWWMAGSENHDLNAKVAAAVSSRIFMEEPAYRERIYPDLGQGPGVGYWQHSAVGDPGPPGNGNYRDGKSYRAREHYQAWLGFFHRYFAERAQHGFFVENASLIYMKWTLNFLHALHAYGGDPAVKESTRQFLDLVWADWAQTQITGIRGGPATRNQHSVSGYDSMTTFARFYLGGAGTTVQLYGHQLFADYEWPEVVWDLALDTRGRGSYAILQNGVGEEMAVRPRPAGLEQTMMINPESRMVKSSWVTPDFILGTQMDHPDAVHSHLSTVGRWQGLIVAGDPAARIVTASSASADGKADMEILFQSVHAGTSLLTQQARLWTQINPEWYPARAIYQKPAAVFIGKAWDTMIERDGWVFVAKGNAYAAVRILEGKRDDTRRIRTVNAASDLSIDGSPRLVQLADQPWKWSQDGATMMLENSFSPIIIEAGRQADYGSFESFQKAVVAARVELQKTVVTGFYLVKYKGPAKDARELFLNAATPDLTRIDGQPVAYRLEKAFDSPYVASKGTDTVIIRNGKREQVLRFIAATVTQ